LFRRRSHKPIPPRAHASAGFDQPRPVRLIDRCSLRDNNVVLNLSLKLRQHQAERSREHPDAHPGSLSERRSGRNDGGRGARIAGYSQIRDGLSERTVRHRECCRQARGRDGKEPPSRKSHRISPGIGNAILMIGNSGDEFFFTLPIILISR
jgi:hypothetical protein